MATSTTRNKTLTWPQQVAEMAEAMRTMVLTLEKMADLHQLHLAEISLLKRRLDSMEEEEEERPRKRRRVGHS
jgi:hypothetical protein